MKNDKFFDVYKDIFDGKNRDMNPGTPATIGDIIDALVYMGRYKEHSDKTNNPKPQQEAPTSQSKPVVNKSTWTNMVDSKNGVYICRIEPDKLNIILWNKPFKDIPFKNAINGSFFWDGKPNCILSSNGTVISGNPSHAWRGFPQSVIYYDGKTLHAKVMKAGEISSIKHKWAIGGLGLILPNGQLTSPAKEGFCDQYADVLRTTYKTTLAANTSKNEVYAIIHTHMISYNGLISYYNKIGQVVKDLALDIAIGLDGGGSTNLKLNNQMVFKNFSPRSINHLVTW